MTARQILEQFLRTDPRDVGCDQAMDVLDVYIELLLDGELLGDDPGAVQRQFPGVAAHLHACGSCGEDFQGLLHAVGDRTADE